MLSVYYHAAARPPAPRARHWQPIAIENAGRILRCDRSFGASGRRRRAIVKLGARLLILRGAHTVEAERRADELRAALDDIYPGADAIIAGVPAGGRDDVAMYEISLQLKLDSAPDAAADALKRTCCSCMDYCKIDPTDTSTGLARVHFGISTRRGFESLGKVLDPQAWDTCQSLNFPAAYYAGNTCPSGTSIPTPASPNPNEGTTWPTGILFEDFESNFELGNAVFKNLLNITTLLDKTRLSYSMDYGLCAALESQVLDETTPTTGMGVDEDCGYAKAIDTSTASNPDQSLVDGLKCIKFSKRESDFGLDDWAQFGLEALADGVANTGVCCGPDAAPATPCDCAEDCEQARVQNPSPPPPADPKHCKRVRDCNPTAAPQ